MRHLLGEFPVDPEYDLWVEAWLAYYKAADEIDGHIKAPRTPEERQLCGKARNAGTTALHKVLSGAGYFGDIMCENSRRAKREALRRQRD